MAVTPPTTAVSAFPRGNPSNRQYAPTVTLFSLVDTAGDGPPIDVRGVIGVQTIVVVKTGAGTCDVELESTVDDASVAGTSSTWFDTRYNVLGSSGAITTSAGVTSLSGGTQKLAAQVLDRFPTLRLSVENISGAVSVTAYVYLAPQS